MVTRRTVATSAFGRSIRGATVAPFAGAFAAIVVGGCQPDFGDRPSEIRGPRILAVLSEPAEAAQGKPASYAALVVDPSGTRADAPIDWAYCTLPRSVADPNDASSACFVLAADWIQPLGVGAAVSGKLPKTACRQFGPDVPETTAGAPPGRPADPDASGGFYQPVRLILPEAESYVLGLGDTRLSCGLPAAPGAVVQEFKKRYRANENPVLESVVALREPPVALTPESGPDAPLIVGRGEALRLRASWPACPASPLCGDGICGSGEDVTTCAADCKDPHGCGGAEAYVYYDPVSRTLVARREAMSVSWFASNGEFAADRTGVGEDESSGATEDTWTAPDAAGPVHLWVVLRDDRGGATWGAFRVDVQ